MRIARLTAAAFIAATACTDATAPDRPTPSASVLVAPIKTTSPASATVAPTSLFAGYSPQSSHYPHITTMMTDFYYSWTSAERAWAGMHYDYAMSGTGSAWRAANPTVGHLTYALLWTTMTTGTGLASSYYADMQSWFATHPQYSLEKAFVHKKGAPINQAGRVFYNHWGSNRWAINPADAGAIAYSVSRVQRIVASESGIFFDEAASGDRGAHLGSMAEFSGVAAYNAAIAKLIGALKRGIGTKTIMLNTAEYMTPADSLDAIAAGAVHLEMFNNFKYSGMIPRWVWIGKLASLGVFVDVVSTYSTQDMAGMTTSYPKGNSTTNVQRAKLWELASYYLAVPSSPKLVALQLENQWSKPYSTLWTKAQEANIGHPTAVRVQTAHGTDPMGNQYIVYNRDFDRALVVLRLQQGWGAQTYTDGSAITIPLPAGERWIPLNADATVGAPVTSIRLRNSEAAILLKGSTM